MSYLRRERGLSQEEVAERIGVSRQAVAKWETGATTPDLENSIALAEFYGVTLDDLVKFDANTFLESWRWVTGVR